MLRKEPQGDIGLTARAEKRHAGAILVIISKRSARLLWMQEAGTRLGRMRELEKESRQENAGGCHRVATCRKLGRPTTTLAWPWNKATEYLPIT